MKLKNNYKIYGLSSSENPDIIRYIGLTGLSLEKRLYFHLKSSKKPKTHKEFWITKVLKSGYSIISTLIEGDLLENIVKQKEIEYIKIFKSLGANLVNGTMGGDGVLSPTLEIRKKMGAKNIGRPSWNKGIPCSNDVKEKSRQKQLGKKLPQTQKDKIKKNNSKFWLGKKMTKEHIENSKNSKRKNYETNKNNKEYVRNWSLSRSKAIIQFDKNGNFIREWESIKKAENDLKISQISACCCGKRKSAGGFTWKHKY